MSVAVQNVDISGMEYVAQRGKQKGNRMMVVGPDKDFLLEDRWLVRSLLTRDVWSVEGGQLRDVLRDKIEQHWNRLQELEQKKKQTIAAPIEIKIEPKPEPVPVDQPKWMAYDIEEFVNAELVLSFYSKLLQDWMIIISHKGMFESHKPEIQLEFERHGGAVYTIDELNDLVEASKEPQYLKNFHLLKKTFSLRYQGKSKSPLKGEML